MAKKVLMQGNVAAAEAAIRAGMALYAGYPITPQTTLTEYLSWRMEEVGGQFIQAECEPAAINMVLGASVGGARAMTATSGPGFSLMQEGLSAMCGGHLPSVVINVMRSGAGGGSITSSQADYNLATKSAGHGGLRAFVEAPSSVQEFVDLVYDSFDIAEKYRTPVVILVDGMIGQMHEPVVIPKFKQFEDRRATMAPGEKGRPKRVFKDTLSVPVLVEKEYDKACEMYEVWQKEEVRCEELYLDDAEYVIVAFGSAARIASGAVQKLREEGIKVGMLRPVTLFPFPKERIAQICKDKVKAVLTVEMARPAMFYEDVSMYLDKDIPHHVCTRAGGVIITPEEVEEAFRKIL